MANEKKKNTPYESSTRVAEGGPFVCHLMEVVQVVEVEAQFSTYWHPSHEIGCDFLSANLSFPREKEKKHTTFRMLDE